MNRGLSFLFVALMLAAGRASAQEVGPPSGQGPCAEARSEAVIREIAPNGEIRLASDERLRLVDIRLPDGEAAGPALAWLGSLAGRRVAVGKIAEPDRWLRHAASVALLDETAPLDIADLLVAEGLALVDAGERDWLCRPGRLALEEGARSRGRGLWARDPYKPVPAADLARLTERVGRFTLVEGRVRSVGERRQRTYLNFGAEWTRDFTITIPKRSWARLRDKGLSAAALKGRRVRARGVVESWGGPAIEIVAADNLEILDRDETRRRR